MQTDFSIVEAYFSRCASPDALSPYALTECLVRPHEKPLAADKTQQKSKINSLKYGWFTVLELPNIAVHIPQN